jgi:hypothetical protein
MGGPISGCAESGPAWLSFVHGFTSVEGQAISFARVEINHDPSATTQLGGRMDARSVWFRETGEGRPKEQLLIETMFCVYYLSKGRRCFGNARTSASTHFLLIFTLPEARWVDIGFA